MPPGSGWCLPANMCKSCQPQIFLGSQARPRLQLWSKHLRDPGVSRVTRAGWWRGQPQVQGNRSVCSIRNIKTIIKWARNQSAFYYHYASAILNNDSDQMLLQTKYLMNPSFKQLLWLLLSFNNIYLSFKLDIFITGPLINIVICMEFNSKLSQLYNCPQTQADSVAIPLT